MTREELRGIVEGITDEQLKKILDINSSDVGKAKAGGEEFKARLAEAESKLSEYAEIEGRLRESQCEAEEMKKRANELQQVIDKREEAELKRKEREQLEERFKAVAKDARFLNEFTQNGIFGEFSAAVSGEENVGKSDEEIYGELVCRYSNLFEEAPDAPAVVASTGGFGGRLSDGEVREIMGLPALPRN